MLRFPLPLRAGGQLLPPGRYDVSVDEAAGEIVVAGIPQAAGVIHVPALERASKVRIPDVRAQLRKVRGEPRWLLVVRTPPAKEWLASLDQVEVVSDA